MVEFNSLVGRSALLPPGFVLTNVKLDLDILDQRRMLVNHRFTFSLTNYTHIPIEKTPHFIMTDVPKSISEMKLRAYHEMRSLQIEEYPVLESLDDLDCFKLFEVKFAKPVPANRSIKYSIEYECEEPERFYSICYACDHLEVNLEYAKSGPVVAPFVFDGDAYQGFGKKVFWRQFKTRSKNGRKLARFNLDRIAIGQDLTFRW